MISASPLVAVSCRAPGKLTVPQLPLEGGGLPWLVLSLYRDQWSPSCNQPRACVGLRPLPHLNPALIPVAPPAASRPPSCPSSLWRLLLASLHSSGCSVNSSSQLPRGYIESCGALTLFPSWLFIQREPGRPWGQTSLQDPEKLWGTAGRVEPKYCFLWY